MGSIGRWIQAAATILITVATLRLGAARNMTGSLEERARVTYERLVPCIMDNKVVEGRKSFALKFPVDAEEHYKLVLERTAKYRNIKPHGNPLGICGMLEHSLYVSLFEKHSTALMQTTRALGSKIISSSTSSGSRCPTSTAWFHCSSSGPMFTCTQSRKMLPKPI